MTMLNRIAIMKTLVTFMIKAMERTNGRNNMAKYGLCSHVVTNGIYDKKCSHICNHTNHIFDLESVNKIM